MSASYPYQLPDGTIVDLQNSTVTRDFGNVVTITQSNGQITKVATGNTTNAIALVNQIATALGISQVIVTSVLWSTDNSTWVAMPIPIADTVSYYIQVNGSGLPTSGTLQIGDGPSPIVVAIAGGGSSTQIASGNLAVSGAFDTAYPLLVFNSSSALLVTVPSGVIYGH